MAESTTPRLGLHRWSAGSDTVSRAEFDSSFAALEGNAAMFLQGLRSARPAPGVAGRFYSCTDTGTIDGLMYYDDGVAWTPVGSNVEDATVRASGISTVPLTVRGFASQTNSLQDWRDSNGVRVAAITAKGQAFNHVIDPTTPVILGQGAPGQTADLLSLRADDGTVLAHVNSLGNIYAGANQVATLNGSETLTNKTLASPTITGTPTGLTASLVGLGNVNNTSDANKPISTAQAAVNSSVDTRLGALDSDSGMVNLAMATGWTVSGTVACRRIGSLVDVIVSAAVNANTVDVGTAGNIADTLIATVPTGYRPPQTRSAGGRASSSRGGLFALTTGGQILLIGADGIGTAYTIATGQVFHTAFTYLIA